MDGLDRTLQLDRLLQYVETLSRPDGGYGWDDQPDSYLTPTFAAIGIYHLLNLEPPRRAQFAAYIRSAHPIRSKATETRRHTGDPRLFIYQQIQGLLWLKDDPTEFVAEVESFTHPQEYPRMYEIDERPILREQAFALMCRRLLQLSIADAAELVAYFRSRERSNGSYNNTPATDGTDGNLLNTWWSLMALKDAVHHQEVNPSLIPWLQQCQMTCGGFSYQPGDGPGKLDDALYTLAAVWSLNYLGATPVNQQGCIDYLLALFNSDGGCGNRPGEPSCPVATLCTVAALSILGKLEELLKASVREVRSKTRILPLENLNIFTIQLQAPGFGSPAEAVALAKSFKIHLWGAKNSQPGWISKAQSLANAEQVPVTFFQSNEEHRSHVSLPGLGSYTHVNDPTAPADADMGASLEGHSVTWEEFRQRKLAPLAAHNGRMVWQICDNEEFARILLDDSLIRGGYAAISTFHFGCRNMAYTLPFVFRYRHLIPFVSLQDAHGVEPWWWADHLVGFRTLFLAKEPTWEGWLEALDRQWVVAVRHDAETHQRTRYLGGAPGVQEYVQARQSEWQWWDDADPARLQRPVYSAVVVGPDDEFEVARPASGYVLRLRCQWVTTHLAVLLRPVVELVSLHIDGVSVPFDITEQRNNRGQLIDHYYTAYLPNLEPGNHRLTAELRRKADASVMVIEEEVAF